MHIGSASTTRPMIGSDRGLKGGHRCRYDTTRRDRRAAKRAEETGRHGWRNLLRRDQL